MSISENTADGEFELACKHCGEKNPPHFAICWNCGQSLEDAARVEPSELPHAKNEITLPRTASDQPFGRWTGWCELTAVLLITVLSQVIDILAAGGWGARPYPSGDISTLLILPRDIGLSILLWILVRRDRSMAQPVALRECVWLYEVSSALLILAANWILAHFIGMIVNERTFFNVRPALLTITNGWTWAIYGVRFFFSAIYQEILIRVYLQSKLEALLGDTLLAILISALIFAIWHGYSLTGTLQVFATGILFGAVYHFTRRMPRLVLAHWMYNLLLTYLRQLH